MHIRSVLLYVGALLLAAAVAVPAMGQTPKRTQEQRKASYEAHKGDFDYLLGDWEFTAKIRQWGSFGGRWSAVRLGDSAEVLDEYRVVGNKGETIVSTSTVRNYNAVLDQWELISLQDGVGLHDFGTGHKEGGEMHIEQRFGVMSDKPSLWRIRYYNIQPDRFSWSADRSLDDGKTWDKDYMMLEARRVGPAHTMAPVIPPPPAASGSASRPGPM